ncbi:hypothetical protein MYBA111488_06765 [Mycobacterium basiliense]
MDTCLLRVCHVVFVRWLLALVHPVLLVGNHATVRPA